MVLTLIGLSLQALMQPGVCPSQTCPDLGRYAMLRLDSLNGFGLVVVFSAYGGLATFVYRFYSARKMLIGSIQKAESSMASNCDPHDLKYDVVPCKIEKYGDGKHLASC